MKRIIGNIIFWITLISPFIAFIVLCMIGEVQIFGIGGMIRYSWIMLLFIPIGIMSVIIGAILKKNGLKYKKNFVISFICIPILIIFGLYRFIFNGIISYSLNDIINVEKETHLNLPKEIKLSTVKWDKYNVTYVKIINDNSKLCFEDEISNNELWKKTLDFEIKCLLPYDIQYEIPKYDYFVFYNTTTSEYNSLNLIDENICIFMAYQSSLNKLIIINDYIIVK